jgi:carbamoyl-phosphate synthase small subunit
MTKPQTARLALEDGRVFYGLAAGAEGERFGEVVFNTAMTGYQEVFTDPSYRGQIIVMTCPHVGNTGLNAEDPESSEYHLAGLAVREAEAEPSSWRSRSGMRALLREKGIVAVEGFDTRALVRHIRTRGAMRAVLSTLDESDAALVEKARRAPSLSEQDLVGQVSCREVYEWNEGYGSAWGGREKPEIRFHAVVYDFGVKRNILRSLAERGCRVTVVPNRTKAAETLALRPDGVLLSNGPGDPERETEGIEAAKGLIGKIPIFGICLGHQILGLALGAKTFKLKFGHRGANHPVKDLKTGRIAISSQNHGFAVDAESLPPDVEATHWNLNDNTLEGFRHKALPLMAIQYHPEAAPGPHDAQGLFGEFAGMMEAKG